MLGNLTRLVVAALLLGAALAMLPRQAIGQGLQETALVVALDSQARGPYAGAVMVATPTPRGGHIGVILNRPTGEKMRDLFPDHPPSAAVKDPVFFGGPNAMPNVFAMVHAASSPSRASLQIAPGIWLVPDQQTIDKIIEEKPNEARYYVGLVLWRPGELADELRRRWFALRAFDEARLFMPDTSTMHRDLSPGSRVFVTQR